MVNMRNAPTVSLIAYHTQLRRISQICRASGGSPVKKDNPRASGSLGPSPTSQADAGQFHGRRSGSHLMAPNELFATPHGGCAENLPGTL